MKKILNIILFLVFAGFVFGQDATPVALMQKTIKDVHYKPLNMDWKKAKPGIPLKDGEEVRTGFKSLALVKFLDGSLIRVRENTILNVYSKKDGKVSQTNTVVSDGALSFDVKRQGDDEFTFTTPTAIASIRGTGGSIIVDPNSNESMFILEHGLVFLQARGGDEETGTLEPGNTAVIGGNGKVTIRPSTEDEKKKNQNLKATNVKKLIIETENEIIEIEYLESDTN